VSAEFYQLHYNLIRIWISLHKRGTCKQVVADSAVHYLQLSYERTLRNDISVFLVSNTEHKL